MSITTLLSLVEKAEDDVILKSRKHCHATSIEGHATLEHGMRYVVEYVHCEGSTQNDIDRQIAEYAKSMRPVDVRYSMRAGDLMHITVEWA